MKRVQRWRYYCDFCKKAGQSGFHMKNHEAACTLNPGRVCRMCVKLAEGSQAPMAEMLALLPDPTQCMRTTPEEVIDNCFDGEPLTIPANTVLDDDAIKVEIVIALPKLRELVGDCPVCIMAAFRQKLIPLPLVDGFNFTQEMKSLWSDINSTRDQYV